MKWSGFGICTFVFLFLVGAGAASLVKSPRRSALTRNQIEPLMDSLGYETLGVNMNPAGFDGLASDLKGNNVKRLPSVFAKDFDQSDLKLVEFERIADVAYGPHELRNLLDIYLPKKRKIPSPLVVVIHGGGGEKGDAPVDSVYQLLERGYAIAQITYRREKMRDAPRFETEKEYEFPAQIEDCKAAIRFLRAHAEQYGFDSERIGATGFSMGGYLTALLCTTSDTDLFNNGIHRDQSSSIQAGCAWASITDFRANAIQGNYHAACQSGGLAFLNANRGDTHYAKESIEVAEKVSPITYASSSDPPILLITGFNDARTTPHQANSLFIRLRNAGARAEALIVPGADHGGERLFNAKTRTRAADFFDRHLQVR